MFLTTIIMETILISILAASTKTNLVEHNLILEFTILLRQKLYFSFSKKLIFFACFTFQFIFLKNFIRKLGIAPSMATVAKRQLETPL